MPLGVRERILVIRLMEKVNAGSAAAEKLGIAVMSELHNVQEETDMEQADNA